MRLSLSLYVPSLGALGGTVDSDEGIARTFPFVTEPTPDHVSWFVIFEAERELILAGIP